MYNSNIYKVDYNWTSIYDRIYFKNKKDAQSVIDNPNFRDILDAFIKIDYGNIRRTKKYI